MPCLCVTERLRTLCPETALSGNDAAAVLPDTRVRERRDLLRTSEKGIGIMLRKLGWLTAGIGVIALACVAFVPSAGASASTPTTAATPAAAAATTTNADNDRWPLRIQGRPASLDAGGTNAWYFWHDDSGLHIRTTTPAERDHVFTAVLRTGGTFRDVDKVRLENADDVQMLDGGHVLIARFHTYAGIDGVDFRISGGDGVHLTGC